MITPETYLAEINALAENDFGTLTAATNKENSSEAVAAISDRLFLSMTADPVTGFLSNAALTLRLDADIEALDYSSFTYFFLIMLKAYDKDITINNINSIYHALGIDAAAADTVSAIDYGSSHYTYAVTAENVIFSAEFRVRTQNT